MTTEKRKDGTAALGEQKYPRVYAKAAGNLRCNICERVVDKLTEDHVPPQSCLVDRHVELEPFEHFLREDDPRLQLSQSGLRFKTICGDCNSLLGSQYDGALATFAARARRADSAALSRAGRWRVRCRPGLVVRALFGHLLAASTDDAQTVPDVKMRRAVLGPTQPSSMSLRVYYWWHPHREVRLLRSAVLASALGVVELLRFDPLGFAITSLDSFLGLPRLDPAPLSEVNGEIDVPFSLRLVRPPGWPEFGGSGGGVVGGRSFIDAVTARPRAPKAR